MDPWSGGEKLPAASFALQNLKIVLSSSSERDRRFLFVCFVHSSGQVFFYQALGWRPPYITGRGVVTVTLGCVGAPNERTPFRVHDAPVSFVDRFPSRTRNLAAPNQTYRGVFVRPILAQHPARNSFYSFF